MRRGLGRPEDWREIFPLGLEVGKEFPCASVALRRVLGEELYDQGVHLLGDGGVQLPRRTQRLGDVLHAHGYGVVGRVRQLAR